MMTAKVFTQVVRTPSGCLEWTGARAKSGYGSVRLPVNRFESAHRIAYRAAYGSIPDGMVVMHKCDNPPCMEPTHLTLGTHADNALDMVRKGRARPGEPRRGPDWLPPRFSVEQVESLRAEYAEGGITYERMAEREGVSTVTIARLVRGDSYRHEGNTKKARRA